mmetsp:Transcript_15691/g.42353  ORF Transcript_15691/g.42353 Transcript_15691/m.42353 type:complete len:307 (-) Transcript_15691:372-1292(-)
MASGFQVARSPQRRLRVPGLVALLALVALAGGSLGLPRCFAPGASQRRSGRFVGSASEVSGRPRRIARQESVDFKSSGVLPQSDFAHPKLRLLQVLHTGGGVTGELEVLASELLAAYPQSRGTAVATSTLDGSWRLLGASRPGAAVPKLAFFSGGNFQHEGSIHNAGLFKAVLEAQAADVKLEVPEVRIADGRMTVSVEVSPGPGREKTLAYSADLISIDSRTFRRRLVSFDLPEPVGSLNPLMEADDLVMLIYSDDDLLVLQDQNGQLEFLVREAEQLFDHPFLFDTSDFLDVNADVFFRSVVEA